MSYQFWISYNETLHHATENVVSRVKRLVYVNLYQVTINKITLRVGQSRLSIIYHSRFLFYVHEMKGLIDWLIGWLIDWLIDYWLMNVLIDWLLFYAVFVVFYTGRKPTSVFAEMLLSATFHWLKCAEW